MAVSKNRRKNASKTKKKNTKKGNTMALAIKESNQHITDISNKITTSIAEFNQYIHSYNTTPWNPTVETAIIEEADRKIQEAVVKINETTTKTNEINQKQMDINVRIENKTVSKSDANWELIILAEEMLSLTSINVLNIGQLLLEAVDVKMKNAQPQQ